MFAITRTILYKVHPITCHEGTEEYLNSSFNLYATREWVSG